MSMFRKWGIAGRASSSAAEDAAVEQLLGAYRELLMDDGRVDVKSEPGYAACATFLTFIETASREMNLEVHPRHYRATFSANYKALFPDGARHYRVDVLEASCDQDAAIWVNGDKFEFSPEATEQAMKLQQTWSALGTMLQGWPQSEQQFRLPKATSRPLAIALDALDQAWAVFEQRYITELIEIESKARTLIVQAVEQERKLQLLESGLSNAADRIANAANFHKLIQGPEYREEQSRLVISVAKLNSVANFRRKGRDDLGVNILESATVALQRCESECGNLNGDSKAERDAARVLAQDIVGSFAAMRSYLQKVSRCVERVDPHLCNNAGLVQRLVDWEESWEIGAKYVLHAPMLDALCDLVCEIRYAEQLAPLLTTMCNDCDVELFMVLPRIVLLCFLANPLATRAELLRSLLPHRFDGGVKNSCVAGPELKAFIAEFGRVRHLLGSSMFARESRCSGQALIDQMGDHTAAWEVLVRRAVNGAAKDSTCGSSATYLNQEAQSAMNAFMRALECWSLELQRHCPEDWNQCSAILVQCLSGEQKHQRGQFQV